MKFLRFTGATCAFACAGTYALLAYGFIGWGWSDSMPAGWSPLQWTITIAIAALPFLFSVWIAFRCLNYDFKRIPLAALGGIVIIAGILGACGAFARDRSILVEANPPLVAARDSGERPHFPLGLPAAGIALPDGKFLPVMSLTWPQAGWNFAAVTLNPTNGHATINIYRGTNDTASSNQFLGSFEVIGLAKSPSSTAVTLIFQVSGKKELLISARDTTRRKALKIQWLPSAH